MAGFNYVPEECRHEQKWSSDQTPSQGNRYEVSCLHLQL